MNIKKIPELFFENLGIRQTVFKNTFWLVGTQITISLMNVVLLVFVARILGATEYGKFAYAMAFVSIIACLIDLGVSSITTRELAKESEKEKEFSIFFSLKILLSACFFVITFIISFFVTDEPFIRVIIWILSGFVCMESFFQIIYAFFRSRQKMEYEAIIHIGQILTVVILGLFAIFIIPSAQALSYGYLIGSAIVLVIVLFYTNFFVIPLRWSFDKNNWINILKMSWPLTFDFTASWIYLNLDSFMIGLFGKPNQVGLFSVVAKIIAVVIVIAGLISRSFYPALSKFLKESKEKFQLIWDYNMKIMIALALPLIVGGIIFSSKVIHLFYGLENYWPSVLVFQILIFLAGITFLSYPCGMVLAVYGHQKNNFIIISIGFIINIILNLILFFYFGIYGVAAATVITSTIVLLITIIFIHYLTPISPINMALFRVFLASVFSSILTFGLMIQPPIYNLSIIFLVPLGVVIYSVVLFLTDFATRKFLKTNIF